jgi:hypothetical protein
MSVRKAVSPLTLTAFASTTVAPTGLAYRSVRALTCANVTRCP